MRHAVPPGFRPDSLRLFWHSLGLRLGLDGRVLSPPWRIPRAPDLSGVLAAARSPAREVAIVLGAYGLYLLVPRVLFAALRDGAAINAQKVMDVSAQLGIGWEAVWQGWALDAGAPVVLAFNWYYLLAFWPTMAPVAILMYLRHRDLYVYFRNLLVISLALAVCVFALFPVAPPRMMGLTDTIQAYYGLPYYGGAEMDLVYNSLAAMPSMHFAWTFLFGTLFFRLGPPWLKVVGVLYPGVHLFSIVVTGNHYVFDALGGLAVGLLAIALYEGYLRWRAATAKREAMASRRAATTLGGTPAG